jgi:hypothetical protein
MPNLRDDASLLHSAMCERKSGRPVGKYALSTIEPASSRVSNDETSFYITIIHACQLTAVQLDLNKAT